MIDYSIGMFRKVHRGNLPAFRVYILGFANLVSMYWQNGGDGDQRLVGV